MGKTIRRKELSVKDFYYSGRRQAPDGVSQEQVEENIFRSDKWKRMRGVDSEVKNEMNRQLRKEVRQLKKDVYVEDDLDYNTSHRVAKRKSNECYRYS
ncbi:hypothetical protein [Escherichia phage UPEC01]|uniref:Uncharacterized protein n=1 Tax=Escherichia phage vB_EcoM_VR20 TaxID=1567027 RepID=A0A0A7HFV2_9CAUD|nr:hypothetical protein AVV68_gp071 [Escherichia phage vB_EcoM_VR20]AIZ02129.1 hypothetical protein VR20_071 [Escherichia phage vB_EcoM_VR20]QMV33982.1 hypothetical protein [Escherichia phage DK-13]QQG30839.1 hypothetical protein [Escherichia phage UPEC01]